MAHSLILGMTETGKTTLARDLASAYRKQGWKNIALDPLRDPRWPVDFITDDGDEFLEVFWASRRCMVFMDEGGESVGRYEMEMQKTATRGRHLGHSCHFIAQSAVQLAPIIRDQCTHLFLFCSGAKSGKTLAEEFNAPELELCVALKRGEYFHAVKGGGVTFHSRERRIEDVERIANDRGSRAVRNRRDADTARKKVEASGGSSGGGGGSHVGGSVDDVEQRRQDGVDSDHAEG